MNRSESPTSDQGEIETCPDCHAPLKEAVQLDPDNDEEIPLGFSLCTNTACGWREGRPESIH